MSKIVRYDENGKEVFFDYGIDAREAVATGRFFETPSEAEAKVENAAKPEKPVESEKKKGKPAEVEDAKVEDVKTEE
jgi:hypothetical protein